jgi:hypothetical protein
MPSMPSAYDVQRRLMARFGALAIACAVAQALTGIDHLTLWLTPLFLLAALLLSGRYVGEEQLLELRARRLARPAPRPVHARIPWSAERALASLRERSAVVLRGPPAAVAVAHS